MRKIFPLGHISNIPPGHDAWGVGDEPVVVIDITGMEHYATEQSIQERAG